MAAPRPGVRPPGGQLGQNPETSFVPPLPYKGKKPSLLKDILIGIFVAGACQGPKDIPDTVAQAGAAAAEVFSLIDRGHIEQEPNTAFVLEDLTRNCSVHAAGVVIGAKPLVNYLPLKLDDDGGIVTRLDSTTGAVLNTYPSSLGTGGYAPRFAVDGDGRVFDVDELYVADGSILPTSLGVNPQLSIMGVATRVAWRMRDRRLPD